MAKRQPIEIFMPPNVLKAKVGGSGGMDLSFVRRAEKAVQDLKEEFTGWIASDVERLNAARVAYRAEDAETANALFRAAHDLKGQGASFDFPLVARMAASLCTLADGIKPGAGLPLALVDAHVDAIKIIVRDNLKDPKNPTAGVLAKELERQVGVFLDKQGVAEPAK